MATRPNKGSSSGRATPGGAAQKAGGAPQKAGAAPKAGRAGAAGARTPPRRNPLDPVKPVSVGRRPSSAGFLAFVAVMWMAVGVVLFLTLTISWRLVPAIVAFGIGLMFLRGSVTTVLRREQRRSSPG